MNEVTKPRRKLSSKWLIVLLLLLITGWFGFQLFGPNPAIIVSKETTFITEPLRHDGLPDYEKYWLQLIGQGVNPEDNAAVLIWQAAWPGDLDSKDWKPLCQALGMKEIPSANRSLVDVYNESVRQQIALWLSKEMERPEDWDEDEWQSELQVVTAEEVIDEALNRPWISDQIPPLAKWVRENKEPLDLLVQAADKPFYYSPSPTLIDGKENMLFDVMLPHIQQMRTITRAISVRALHHVGEGRHEEAWQDIRACHRLARLTAQDITLIGQFVAISISNIACERTLELLQDDKLSESLANTILRDLQAMGKVTNMIRAMDQGERLMFLDSVIAIFQNKLDLEGLTEMMSGESQTPLNLASVVKIDCNPILRKGNRWYDRLVDAIKLSSREKRLAEFKKIESELQQLATNVTGSTALVSALVNGKKRSELLADVLLSLFLPALSGTVDADDRSVTHIELTRIAAALAVYRTQQGQYPLQLNELAPTILPKLPLDLYSEKPFIYQRKDDGGYLLYSVFQNGVDDGGTSYEGKIIDGEWVDKDSEEFYYDPNEHDLVIRVPMPKFKMTDPPSDDQYRLGGYMDGGYGEDY